MLEANFEGFYHSRQLDANIASLNYTHSVRNYFVILMKFHHSHRLFDETRHDNTFFYLIALRDCRSCFP